MAWSYINIDPVDRLVTLTGGNPVSVIDMYNHLKKQLEKELSKDEMKRQLKRSRFEHFYIVMCRDRNGNEYAVDIDNDFTDWNFIDDYDEDFQLNMFANIIDDNGDFKKVNEVEARLLFHGSQTRSLENIRRINKMVFPQGMRSPVYLKRIKTRDLPNYLEYQRMLMEVL